MHKKVLPAIALALAGTFALGCGDDDDAIIDDDGVVTFNDMDLNGDGFVSASEWGQLDDLWDVDGDHMLDEEEFLMSDSAFGAFDLDDDERVIGAEWASAFDDADLDADGFLNPDELL